MIIRTVYINRWLRLHIPSIYLILFRIVESDYLYQLMQTSLSFIAMVFIEYFQLYILLSAVSENASAQINAIQIQIETITTSPSHSICAYRPSEYLTSNYTAEYPITYLSLICLFIRSLELTNVSQMKRSRTSKWH